MNPDDLINLPDNRPWRLEHVEDIEHFENGFYNVICHFQHVKPWIVVNYRDGEDLKSIKSFDRTYFIRREVNLEYVKCFPIGSIWQKGQAPIMPSYFGEFSITSNVLKGIKPSFDFIKDRIEGSFIASKEDESYFKTDCLIFEPKKPLFAKRLTDGTYSISKEKGGTELTFIKFFGYEIYRFFLTSRTRGTLNHRMLASRMSHNLVFDDSRTKIVDGKRQVYLKNEDDHPNIFLIGNILYDEKFKFAFKRIMWRVLKDGPERLFEGMEFPFDTFSSMKVYAKLVKKENEKNVWGLVVYQIADAQGYQKGTFSPITDRPLAELQKDGNVSFRIKRKKNKKKPKEKFENDPVNSDGDDDVKVEDNTLFGLMNPPLDQTLPQMSIELVDKDGKVVFIGKKEKKDNKGGKVGPSGENEDPDGSNVIITLESMNYFPLFDRIVNRVKSELAGERNEVNIEWFDYDGLRSSSNPKCNRNFDDDDGKNCKAGYACVEIIVGEKYFYLFEKEVGLLNSENRSWLFAFPKFRVIRDQEAPLAVEKYLFDTNRSMKIGDLTEEDLGLCEHLNHANVLPDKLIDDKKELLIYQEFAIKKHSKKILKMINSKLTLT